LTTNPRNAELIA